MKIIYPGYKLKKPPKRIQFKFDVWDIETGCDGQLLDIGHLTQDGEYILFKSWKKFILFLAKRGGISYAHNGGGFDFLPLIIEVVKHELFTPKLIKSGSRIIACKFYDYGNDMPSKEDHCHFELRDSYALLSSGLDKLGKLYLGEGKKPIPKSWMNQVDKLKLLFPVTYYDYLKTDCAVLMGVLEKAIDFFSDQGCKKICYTAAAQSLHVWQLRFNPSKMETYDSKIKEFERLSYRGGWTSFLGALDTVQPGQIVNDVYLYDVNSMYPKKMFDGVFPITGGVYTQSFKPGYLGIYLVSIDVPRDQITPIIAGDPFEPRYTGEYYLTSLELEAIQKIGGKFKIIEGFYYQKTAPLFRDYVDHFYKLRLIDKNSAQGDICKLMLNSLYGKMGQKDESTQIFFYTDLIKYNQKISELESKNIHYIVNDYSEMVTVEFTEYSENQTARPCIASFITAAARLTLWDVIRQNPAECIYCDTDSIHSKVQKPIGMDIGPELGQWGSDGVAERAIYYGKKLYALDINGDIKQKSKGFGSGNTLDLFSGKLDGEFDRMPTFKQLLKGEKQKMKRQSKRVLTVKNQSEFYSGVISGTETSKTKNSKTKNQQTGKN